MIRYIIISVILFLSSSILRAGNLLKKDSTEYLDRKIKKQIIVPKSQWIVGVNFMYNHTKAKNFDLFVINKANVEGYNLKVSPFLLYTFKDNMASGLRFSYERSLTKLNSLYLGLDDMNGINLKDLYKLEHSYSGIILFRNFLSIGNLKRFAFFTDLQLSLSGSQSKILNGKGEHMVGTYERSFSADVGISPGVVAFITNTTAVEVSIGLLGIDYSILEQTTNKVKKSTRISSKGNFMINIFSVGLGISWYI